MRISTPDLPPFESTHACPKCGYPREWNQSDGDGVSRVFNHGCVFQVAYCARDRGAW